MTRVTILGAGALGGLVRDQLQAGTVQCCELAEVLTSADRHFRRPADVLVEAAGVGAVRQWVPGVLDAGMTVVLCSGAALAEPDGAQFIGKVLVPAGALGGLDLFRTVARADPSARIRLHSTKKSVALGTAGAGEVFRGTAREAALRFPRTANVAVALALATTGLDSTEVVVHADPLATRTTHRITARSSLGEHEQILSNTVADGSGGRTSVLTAWSVVQLLEELATRKAVDHHVTAHDAP